MELIDAIEKNDMASIHRLLQEPGIDIDCTDQGGMTALQHACYRGNEELCRLLIDRGANVNTREDRHGYTPLTFAALTGNEKTVDMLLAAGASTSYVSSVGRTASQMAAFVGQHAVVRRINNFFSRSLLDRYTVVSGFEAHPKLAPALAAPLHTYLLQLNLHPVKLALHLATDGAALLAHEASVVRVLDLFVEHVFHDRDGPNDVLCLKAHYMRHVLHACAPPASSVDAFVRRMLLGRPSDGFVVHQERFIRDSLRDFPYADCRLFQMLMRTLSQTPFGSQPCGLTVLTQALFGQNFGVDQPALCACCGDAGCLKTCAKCKLVAYCSRDCQRRHWFAHKKFCLPPADRSQSPQSEPLTQSTNAEAAQ